MDKRIKELAEQAGLHIANNREGRALVFGNQAHVHVLFDELERFAELVRQDEREVNAELLEALKQLCAAQEKGHVAYWAAVWDDARAAIAKAEVTK